jgi:hypothetical protein
VNRRELSEAVAEAAARTEAAAALTREAAARTEAAAALQQEARARQEVATAKLEEIQVKAAERNDKLDDLLVKTDALLGEIRADREDEKIWREEFLRRQEKMFQDYLRRADETLAQTKQQTVEIIAELRDHRDERRAFKEALLKLIDRLPPPPPHLRSA